MSLWVVGNRLGAHRRRALAHNRLVAYKQLRVERSKWGAHTQPELNNTDGHTRWRVLADSMFGKVRSRLVRDDTRVVNNRIHDHS